MNLFSFLAPAEGRKPDYNSLAVMEAVLESGGDVNSILDLRPEQAESLRKAIAHAASSNLADIECGCTDLPPPPTPSPPLAAKSGQNWNAFAGAPPPPFGLVTSTPMPPAQPQTQWSAGACALSPQPPAGNGQPWKWSLSAQPSGSTTVVAAPSMSPQIGANYSLNTLPKAKAGVSGGAIPKTFSGRKLRARK